VFHRTSFRRNNNAGGNDDVYQMWSMQRDGDYVYIISVRSGRRVSPIVLQRVPWNSMLDPNTYQSWNATTQTWGAAWTAHNSPLIAQTTSRIGEPSLRKITNPAGGHKWVMSYLNLAKGQIVTRIADAVTGPWGPEVNQLSTPARALYGGFIHPYSDSGPNGLTLMVSSWQRAWYNPNQSVAYHVEQWRGTA
jgi:hypothetical protein